MITVLCVRTKNEGLRRKADRMEKLRKCESRGRAEGRRKKEEDGEMDSRQTRELTSRVVVGWKKSRRQ